MIVWAPLHIGPSQIVCGEGRGEGFTQSERVIERVLNRESKTTRDQENTRDQIVREGESKGAKDKESKG